MDNWPQPYGMGISFQHNCKIRIVRAINDVNLRTKIVIACKSQTEQTRQDTVKQKIILMYGGTNVKKNLTGYIAARQKKTSNVSDI